MRHTDVITGTVVRSTPSTPCHGADPLRPRCGRVTLTDAPGRRVVCGVAGASAELNHDVHRLVPLRWTMLRGGGTRWSAKMARTTNQYQMRRSLAEVRGSSIPAFERAPRRDPAVSVECAFAQNWHERCWHRLNCREMSLSQVILNDPERLRLRRHSWFDRHHGGTGQRSGREHGASGDCLDGFAGSGVDFQEQVSHPGR